MSILNICTIWRSKFSITQTDAFESGHVLWTDALCRKYPGMPGFSLRAVAASTEMTAWVHVCFHLSLFSIVFSKTRQGISKKIWRTCKQAC